ncbi:DUF2931 family protein [Chryseobacterium sp.]|nr:DUF2931 family protein [Chryseobacterium sp.]
MKKNLKIHLTKGNTIRLFWMLMIGINLLQSCSNKKYRWEAGISAPKYYPVSDVRISFENAGNGSLTSLDPGWGQTYGAVVGEKWKNIPKEVSIHYNSGAENYTYEGKVLLPQEKIRDLFNEYNLDDEDNSGHLVVGLAPGGWIRVWFQTIDRKANDLVNIEVIKAKLKGSYDNTADERYKVKNFENWGKYYVYWQNHGIPSEAWAINEKEHDMYFDFNRKKYNKVVFSYISSDGTYYQGQQGKAEIKLHQKLPVQFEQMAWLSRLGDPYNCKVPMPKNFKKYIEQKKLKEIKLLMEIENDDEHAIIYLIVNNVKEKIVRFKNKQPTQKESKDVDFDYATEVEYFIH